MKTIAKCSCNFVIDILQKLMKENSEKNMIVCSVSTYMSLIALCIGSRGITADQLKQALSISLTEPETSTDLPFLGGPCYKPGGPYYHWKQILSAIIQYSENYQLKIAQRYYALNTFEILQSFKHCIKEVCNSELESVDFMNETEKVRQQINFWFESQTNGEIINLFPANSIQSSSLLVSANAVYFKGTWKEQFNPKNTHRAVFWTCKDQSYYVEMMTQQGYFNIATIKNPSMKVLELPHENGDIVSYFCIPEGHVTTDEITKKLSYEKFQEWTSPENMRNIPAKVYVPKLSLTADYSMKACLMGMGVSEMFIPEKANFSGISHRPGLVVTDMRSTNCFKMDEEGGVAAGASRAEIVHGSHSEVKCNKPFLITVLHKPTGIILFFISVCKPQ